MKCYYLVVVTHFVKRIVQNYCVLVIFFSKNLEFIDFCNVLCMQLPFSAIHTRFHNHLNIHIALLWCCAMLCLRLLKSTRGYFRFFFSTPLNTTQIFLQKFEKQYHKELEEKGVTYKSQFEYAMCLVRSQYPSDMKKVIFQIITRHYVYANIGVSLIVIHNMIHRNVFVYEVSNAKRSRF